MPRTAGRRRAGEAGSVQIPSGRRSRVDSRAAVALPRARRADARATPLRAAVRPRAHRFDREFERRGDARRTSAVPVDPRSAAASACARSADAPAERATATISASHPARSAPGSARRARRRVQTWETAISSMPVITAPAPSGSVTTRSGSSPRATRGGGREGGARSGAVRWRQVRRVRRRRRRRTSRASRRAATAERSVSASGAPTATATAQASRCPSTPRRRGAARGDVSSALGGPCRFHEHRVSIASEMSPRGRYAHPPRRAEH